MKVNNSPLQTSLETVLKTGFGFTFTSNVNGIPSQSPNFGLIVYVTSWISLELFIKVWEIEVTSCAINSPSIFELEVTFHVYVVPVGAMFPGIVFGKKLKAKPLQISIVWFVITGVGFTVTTKSNGSPLQLSLIGLIT